MQHLDLQVTEQALAWARSGKTLWLCTVLATFGSSPREPGSLLVACDDGKHIGSLSGGCVEEDFLARVQNGEFKQTITTVRYGDPEGLNGSSITLPCGGILEVLIERLPPSETTLNELETLHTTLLGQQKLIRCINLENGERHFIEDKGLGPRVMRSKEKNSLQIRIGPVTRLIIAGISPISVACAAFAHTLGFEVIVCDPREEACANFNVPGVKVEQGLPSELIASGGCHAATAIVALTHDPRIDDLAMMEAVQTPAFYIGVMGSKKTSNARAKRLLRSGGLSEEDLTRLHMPIGLALGSKTPAEIALAVMADIVRVQRGIKRDAL